jgi:transposase
MRAHYDSMAARNGRKSALLIIGHKILNAAYLTLTARLPYVAYSVEGFYKIRNKKLINNIQNELKELGVSV